MTKHDPHFAKNNDDPCKGCSRWDDGLCDGVPEHCEALLPERQISNVLHALAQLVDGPIHRYRMTAIRSTVKQLSDMWQKCQAGELEPTMNELPF